MSPQPLAFPARNTPVLTPPLHLSRCSCWATTTIAVLMEERGQWAWTISVCRSRSALSSKQLELVSAHWVFLLVIKEPTKEAHKANPCGGSHAYCQDLGAAGRKTVNLRPTWTMSASSLYCPSLLVASSALKVTFRGLKCPESFSK